jgi:hypothetical protein
MQNSVGYKPWISGQDNHEWKTSFGLVSVVLPRYQDHAIGILT